MNVLNMTLRGRTEGREGRDLGGERERLEETEEWKREKGTKKEREMRKKRERRKVLIGEKHITMCMQQRAVI